MWEKQAAATLRLTGPGSIERRYSCVINLHCHLRFYLYLLHFPHEEHCHHHCRNHHHCGSHHHRRHRHHHVLLPKICQEMACCGESQEPEDQEVRTFVAGRGGWRNPKIHGEIRLAIGHQYMGGFLTWGISKTIGFNTKMVIHDLDDLGVPP